MIRRKRVSAEIPTASFADVAFLLLIFFMITATFAATKGLDIAFPPQGDGPVDPLDSVLVEVGRDGSLTVDRRPLQLSALLAYLQPRLAVNPGKPVIVHTDPQAPYGAMVTVLDELRQGRRVLGLERDIRIAIPTEREVAQLWR